MGLLSVAAGDVPKCIVKMASLGLIAQKSFSTSVAPIKMAYAILKSDETNSAAPLIIMHGLFGSKQNWRGISKALHKNLKRRIYSVDARNHGDSPHHSAHSSAHMAADIVELMRLEGLPKAALLGHSMGGRTMMYFALKYPQLVERAIFVDISPISIPRDVSKMEELFIAMKNISAPAHLSLAEGRRIVERQIQDAVGENSTVDFIMQNLKKSDTGEFVWSLNVAALHENLGHFQDFGKEIEAMTPFNGPVMFICGNKSNFVDPKHWPNIQQIFPNSEIHWLDAGHLVHFDQPAEFINLATRFLKK